MEESKQALIDKALEKYGKIYPCENKKIEDCFTQEEDLLIFWFNDDSGSTRIVTDYL